MSRAVHTIAAIGLWVLTSAGVARADGKIYWTDSDAGKIQRANLDGSGIEDVITGLSQPLAVALDVAGGKVYWVQANGIRRANLDGSNVETVNGIAARGIALDLGAGKLYFSQSLNEGGWVFRANLDGSEFETLVSAVPDPAGIALDRDGGKMYWAGASGGGFVQRANLDGSNIEVLVTIPQGTPWEIALDVAAGKMYWADAGTRAISRANLDGSNVQNLVTSASGLSRPVGVELDLAGGKIYWTDYLTKKVQRANLDGSNVEDVITAGLSGPGGIALDLRPTIPTASSWGLAALAVLFLVAGGLVLERHAFQSIGNSRPCS